MRLTNKELDALVLHQAGVVAQKRLARGLKLNHPEAVALIASQVQEFARDGLSVAETTARGSRILGRNHVMPGVAEMIHELSIEACFDDGTKLVCLNYPITEARLPFDLALYGSFIQKSALGISMEDTELQESEIEGESVNPQDNTENGHDIFKPGEVLTDDTSLVLNEGRLKRELRVTSVCDRPIQIGSHFPFIEANPNLIFDRAVAYGMRLDIPSGMSVRFEPGDTKRIRLVELAGNKRIYGGNNISLGPLSDERLSCALDTVHVHGFRNANEKAAREPIDVPLEMKRHAYAENYGPSAGDRVRLGDTNLFIKVESDTGSYGDEVKFGGGKVIRDGMGQAVGYNSDRTLDLVLTNALIIDAVSGIIKADIGIKNNQIIGIGKAGNPDIMPNVNPLLVIGAGTEVVAAEGMIITAGAIDCHVHYICPQLIEQALQSGVTTLIGGGTGPTQGTRATTCTPGPNNIRNMFESCDVFPVNIGFTGKGNCSSINPETLAPELEDQIRAGAMGLKLHEDWGTTPSAIDSCLRVAEKHDIQVMIHTDTLNEAGCVEDTLRAFRDRTVHAYHAEGAGGGHAPDLLRVCGEKHIIPSSTNPTRPYTVNTMDEVIDMLMICHHLDKNIREDLAFAESRMRAETVSAEDILHDLGAISLFTSDSQAMGRIGETVCRTWQTAHKMKEQYGPLPEDAETNSDNFRVKRYIAKYTINPARAHGIADYVGSVEEGKYADLVLWHPAFFGVKPELIIKGGQIVTANIGPANASIPTAEPMNFQQMFGSCGTAVTRNSLYFVSEASLTAPTDIRALYRVRREMRPVKGTRTVSKQDMLYNNYVPQIAVDPETYEVTIKNEDGEKRTLQCEPAQSIPLARRYLFF
ncbi:uncharacterized protein LOC111272285 isoform X2 [Varroa jacobsoni]|uniref:uncharacterized protein LOC111272285 isoform X2 n=1 Tax=Varroa jacobsoni TaxID=62625 RepID=UPI000BF81F9E|nr:uncharacterized protein LOC111272285 isoform X2 [Varroa jacobsoni]